MINMITMTGDFDYSLNQAEKIEEKLNNAINELDQIINLINKSGPQRVIRRGVEFEREQASSHIEEAIDKMDYVATYLHEYSKNLHREAS